MFPCREQARQTIKDIKDLEIIPKWDVGSFGQQEKKKKKKKKKVENGLPGCILLCSVLKIAP